MACPFAKLATMLGPLQPAAGKDADFHHHHHHHPHRPAASSSSTASHATTLGEALRLGTSASHRAVERSLGVSLLLSSTTSSSSTLAFTRLDYVRFQIMLLCIYTALEASLVRSAAHLQPLFQDGLMGSLARSAVLSDDVGAHLEVVHLHSGVSLSDIADASDEAQSEAEELWQLLTLANTSNLTRQHLSLLTHDQTAATLHYVQRLTHASPPQLLAHAYTRYLGDLSGGQHIVRKVSKRFPCTKTQGFGFYRFDNPADLKSRFRAALETCTVPNTSEVVQEANAAFALNTRVFESLLPPELRQVQEEDKVLVKHSAWNAEPLVVAALLALSLVYLLASRH